jgi:monoterpene epsilon-lactone hydrolase
MSMLSTAPNGSGPPLRGAGPPQRRFSNLLTLIAALAGATSRRLRAGPLHPGWSLTYEALNEFLRRSMTRFSRLPWPEQREAWASLSRPDHVLRRVRVDEIVAGGVAAEWVVPEGVRPDAPVMLYLHGGGFAHGSVGAYRPLVARLAIAAGARALAPEYRLAPEHPFPAALQDALAVYRSLRTSGSSASRIVVAGDSAGGNLAAATLIALRDAGDPQPAAAVLICPWVDLDARDGSVITNARYDWVLPESFDAHANAYLPAGGRSDPLASPARAELRGLAPLLVQAGGAELLLDQVRAFAAKAQDAGVEVELEVYPGMTHVWHSLAGAVPALETAIDAIGRFVRGHVQDDPRAADGAEAFAG